MSTEVLDSQIENQSVINNKEIIDDNEKNLKDNSQMFVSESNDEENINKFENKKQEKRDKRKSHVTALTNTRILSDYIMIVASNLRFQHRIVTNLQKFIQYTKESVNYKYLYVEQRVLLTVLENVVSYRLENPNKIPEKEYIITRLLPLLDGEFNEFKNYVFNLIEKAKDSYYIEELEDKLSQMASNIETDLKYGLIYDSFEDIEDLTWNIRNTASDRKSETIESFRDLLTKILDFFKKTDNINEKTAIKHTSEQSFLENLFDTFDSIINPSSALTTGWQSLNDLLGPRKGFLNKNAYVFYANTNTFKSALLLHIARMISKYNNDAFVEKYNKTKKRPTILFISAENDSDEDNERFYKYITHKNIGDCASKDDLYNSWNNSFGIGPNSNLIDISFMHVDARRMSVEDIDNTIESLNDQGYEVIACIFDYLALIAPRRDDIQRDIRIQLQHIAEDILILAKNRNIPFITAHQLNRAGGALLNMNKQNGGTTAVSLLSNEFIGESYGIEQAVSWTAFIDVEIHNGKKYLTFKGNKVRSQRKDDNNRTFVMEIHDGILIADDIYLDKPLSHPTIPVFSDDGLDYIRNSPFKNKTIDIRDPEYVKQQKELREQEKLKEKLNKKYDITYITAIMDRWCDYSDEIGWEPLVTESSSEIGIEQYENELLIGETEYIFNENEEEFSWAS